MTFAHGTIATKNSEVGTMYSRNSAASNHKNPLHPLFARIRDVKEEFLLPSVINPKINTVPILNLSLLTGNFFNHALERFYDIN